MREDPPEKINLVPDRWHIRHVGRLGDGRMFFIARQLLSIPPATMDFACTFIFDDDGRLIEHAIEEIGVRGQYAHGHSDAVMARHLSRVLGIRRSAIKIRLFTVRHQNADFGMIPRRIDDGSWRVEFMPGNTLSFFPPWEAGGYDT